MLHEEPSYWPRGFGTKTSRRGSYLKQRPNSAALYLCATQYSAELECFLTRLGCSIKDGLLLMNSVAQVFEDRVIGVIMTGMGSDGAIGMASIFQQGGLTIGQDEASCTVYGMPRACAQLGILMRVAPLSDIPTHIMNATRRRRRA